MKSLWFKQCFVEPILQKEKRDTIRKLTSRIPNVGDIVNFTVGPRPPFAQAKISAVKPIDPTKIPPHRLKQVLGCYADISEPLVKINFHIVD